MILRSIVKHVRDQNWTAVGIDFVIVVVGVFIGIQVSNWNDARSDKVREREYYDQIVKDLRADVAMARLVAHQAGTFSRHGDYLLAAIEDPDFVIEDTDYFALSVARAGYTRFPVFSRHAIDELESVGGLTLLRDRELKSVILDYYAFASDSDQWNDLLRDQQMIYKQAYKGLLSRNVERRIGERISTFGPELLTWANEKAKLGDGGLDLAESEAMQVLERARKRDDLKDALALMAAVHVRLKLRATLIEQRAEALIETIEAHIDEGTLGNQDTHNL